MDVDAIREEILKYSPRLDTIQPGDITLEMIQETRKCSYDAARCTGRKMIESGEYIKVSVRNQNGRPSVVFRKVNKK